MDIKNLITFMYTAELNSFTKAAQTLGYSQSTISFQIKQLENELDTQLFERINRTVTLTEKGREVLKYAQQVTKLTQELEKNMQNENQVAGHVSLAMADSLCDSMFRDGFRSFRQSFPGITLKIIAAGTEEMFRLMNHNEVDAILTLDNHIYNTEYHIVQEEKVDLHFVASPDFPFITRKSIPIQELIQYPFILTEKGMSYRRLMDEKLAEMSLKIEPILEIGSTGLICPLVEQGAGISFLPDYVTDRDIKNGSLIRLNVPDFEITIWKQLLYHRDKWISPQIETVLNYCIEREFGH